MVLRSGQAAAVPPEPDALANCCTLWFPMPSWQQRGTDPATSSTEPIPAEAARAQLLDLDGSEHTLTELWRDRPVVLVFLRHFG